MILACFGRSISQTGSNVGMLVIRSGLKSHRENNLLWVLTLKKSLTFKLFLRLTKGLNHSYNFNKRGISDS